MKECTAHSTHTDTEWRWPRDTYAITPNAIQFLLLLHSLNFNFCTDWGRYLLDVAHKLCMRYSPDYLPAKRRRQNVLIHRLGGRSVRIQTFAKQQCDDDNGDIFKLSINTQVCCLLPTRKVFFYLLLCLGIFGRIALLCGAFSYSHLRICETPSDKRNEIFLFCRMRNVWQGWREYKECDTTQAFISYYERTK